MNLATSRYRDLKISICNSAIEAQEEENHQGPHSTTPGEAEQAP